MYDLIIVGGGPAGAAAAVYAARKQLKTLMVVKEWGGQSNVSPDIQNWIGTKSISGDDLAKALREHSEAYAGDVLTIKSGPEAKLTSATSDSVSVTFSDDTTEEAKTLLIASGSTRRKLKIPGAEEFDQKGLTYCATCDGPVFAGQDVVIVGGGNAAFETAAQLLAYTKSVTLINRSDVFKADEVTVEKVLANPKMTAIKKAESVAVLGEKFVKGFTYKDTKSGEEKTLNVTGVFVEIGLIPSTDWLGESVELTKYKQVVVDPRTQRTSHERIWAAGDCTDGLYHQNNIATGDAVKALEALYMFVHTR